MQALPYPELVPLLLKPPLAQVMPQPQPISWDDISHGMLVLSTKRMPESAARPGVRGLPPLRLGGSLGKSGSMGAQSWSVISSLARLLSYSLPGVVRRTKSIQSC